MSRFYKVLTGAALAMAVAMPSYADEATAETVVATVGDFDITLGHMIVTRGALPAQYQSLPNEVLFNGILEQLIQQVILSEAAGEPDRALRLTIENEIQAIVATHVVQGAVESAVTDEAVQAAYEAAYAGAEPVSEFNASHILVETEEEALSLIEELSGGADFAALAREHSTGPSGQNGGELGWFGTGMMVPEFEEAVVSLEDGQVSAPVQTQFGWHVVILNETRIQAAPELESVREELVAEIQNAAISALIEDLTEQTTVTRAEEGSIDVELLSNTDLLQD